MLFMFMQYRQWCCAYVQSIVRVTERYGGIVVFTYLNPDPEVGDIGWGVVELPLFLKEDAENELKMRAFALSRQIFCLIHSQ